LTQVNRTNVTPVSYAGLSLFTFVELYGTGNSSRRNAEPLAEGSGFCVFGGASGLNHHYTNLKEFSFGANGWVSDSRDRWPIGWINSHGHLVNKQTLKKYPNHFAPDGTDFFR
jgi:hypothetical protein